MAMLIAEHGFRVSIFDVNAQNVDNCVEMRAAQKETIKDKVSGYKGYKSFVDSVGNEVNKLFILSITYGSPVDEVLKSLYPFLKKGDIILDGGNEWYLNLEARQKKLHEKGIGYVGMGFRVGISQQEEGLRYPPVETTMFSTG